VFCLAIEIGRGDPPCLEMREATRGESEVVKVLITWLLGLVWCDSFFCVLTWTDQRCWNVRDGMVDHRCSAKAYWHRRRSLGEVQASYRLAPAPRSWWAIAYSCYERELQNKHTHTPHLFALVMRSTSHICMRRKCLKE
jgi:hypothetical protein